MEVVCDLCQKSGDSVFPWNGSQTLCWVCLKQSEDDCREELMKQW